MSIEIDEYEVKGVDSPASESRADPAMVVRSLAEHSYLGFSAEEISEATGILLERVAAILVSLNRINLVEHESPYWTGGETIESGFTLGCTRVRGD